MKSKTEYQLMPEFQAMYNIKEWGGKRKNAGAKSRYNEPTKTVSFRVPISHVEHVKSMIKTLCELWAAK